MKLFQICWAIRIDPKDPNTVPGMDITHFTMDKPTMKNWCENGIPLRKLGYNSDDKVRVKWVFPLVVLCPRRNCE